MPAKQTAVIKTTHSKTRTKKSTKSKSSSECMCELEEMAKEMVAGMYPEEKQAWRVELNKLINM